MAINNFLDSHLEAANIDLKFSTDEVLVENDGKAKKVIAYHAILIYEV